LKGLFDLLALLLAFAHLCFLSIPFQTDDTIVAVIDSGVNPSPHSKDKIMNGYDFIDWDHAPLDEHGHGSHMAGFILEKAPSASILPVRVLDEEAISNGTPFLGILYAITQGADIVNLSLSEAYYNPLTHWSIFLGQQKGVVFVASSGNDAKKDINYPSKYSGVISVGAIDGRTERLYELTNISDEIDFVASGVNVPSLLNENEYYVMSGTSVSAAQVSGMVAYLLEKEPTMERSEVVKSLHSFAYPTRENYRRIDFEKIVAHYKKNKDNP
jgi:subtilisin family serine protease